MPRHATRRSCIARTASLLAATALLAACGDGGQTNQARPPSADIVATAEQDGSTLSLRPGQRLEIRLEGNSTIYPPVNWSLAATPPILRPGGEEVVSDDPQAVGEGATWIFRFIAIGEGEGRLLFSGGESGRRVNFLVASAQDGR